jgi:hypothetical protein
VTADISIILQAQLYRPSSVEKIPELQQEQGNEVLIQGLRHNVVVVGVGDGTERRGSAVRIGHCQYLR